ncbi:alpha/beta fold hydrolase [Paenibacillus sabinae]|uniref:alpha/beta fold hydrolase n=1 Tax=Paenibacillus sabinae TaxID=365617 RepID=UPI0006843FD8
MDKLTETRTKRGFALLVLAFIAAVALALWVYLKPYALTGQAETALVSGKGITIEMNDNWISLEPLAASGAGVIFYPGGLVKAEAYAPLARGLAAAGHPVYIARMPLNLAMTRSDAAEEIIRVHPGLSFVLGGHSLGGVIAARYAASHPDELAGVFFLASYPDEKGSLKSTTLAVLSVLGTEDKVVDPKKYREGRAYLPDSTVYYSLEGGNHAQFGSYGPQKGDGEATITENAQQKETVRALLDWMSNLR